MKNQNTNKKYKEILFMDLQLCYEIWSHIFIFFNIPSEKSKTEYIIY